MCRVCPSTRSLMHPVSNSLPPPPPPTHRCLVCRLFPRPFRMVPSMCRTLPAAAPSLLCRAWPIYRRDLVAVYRPFLHQSAVCAHQLIRSCVPCPTPAATHHLSLVRPSIIPPLFCPRVCALIHCSRLVPFCLVNIQARSPQSCSLIPPIPLSDLLNLIV
jgi:hypothetical protein